MGKNREGVRRVATFLGRLHKESDGGGEEWGGRAAGRDGESRRARGLNRNRRKEAEERRVERNAELHRTTRGLDEGQRRETGAGRAKRGGEPGCASGPGDGR